MGIIAKKLAEDELKSVRDIKQEYTNLALLLGELELQKFNLFESYKHILEKEGKLAQTLQEKYGEGTIDINTGEIKS
jgi:hypothetical protein